MSTTTSTSPQETASHADQARATTLSNEQAEYIGVPVDGPYKPDNYRY